jgi:hypothetical protein
MSTFHRNLDEKEQTTPLVTISSKLELLAGFIRRIVENNNERLRLDTGGF